MKKSTLFTTTICALTLFLSSNANAQKFPDLDKSPLDAAWYPNDYKDANKAARVIYGRPQLKGRNVSELAPNGKVWRTGANEAAEITLYTDMSLGKTKIAAGVYTMYTIPGEKEWTVIINKDKNVWGAYTYNDKNDVARLAIPVTTSTDSLEAFSMVFTKADKGVTLNVGWGTTRLAVPFTN
ncbi:Protein of unknown function [Flavobacterium segetis]|uniref:DUF2911 domain-containing protein n=1 Tax=Flavobacterium segetis TaxID=271157 RepID=A0A1M5GPI6_9FLAO|nr:DUF2911 domain-containing protein [Flavobacterium segetis]SHG05613.1 Protein of unknown function [Flavobacterium segetis]